MTTQTDLQALKALKPDYRTIVDKHVDSIIDELRKHGAVKPFSILESAILKRLTDLGDAAMANAALSGNADDTISSVSMEDAAPRENAVLASSESALVERVRIAIDYMLTNEDYYDPQDIAKAAIAAMRGTI